MCFAKKPIKKKSDSARNMVKARMTSFSIDGDVESLNSFLIKATNKPGRESSHLRYSRLLRESYHYTAESVLGVEHLASGWRGEKKGKGAFFSLINWIGGGVAIRRWTWAELRKRQTRGQDCRGFVSLGAKIVNIISFVVSFSNSREQLFAVLIFVTERLRRDCVPWLNVELLSPKEQEEDRVISGGLLT